MRLFVLFILSLLTIHPLVGQIKEMKDKLEVEGLTDAQKVKIYEALSKAYYGEQLDSSAVYADRSYQLAIKLNSPEDIAKALIRQSILLTNEGDLKKAIEKLKQAENLAKTNQHKEVEAWVYNSLAKSFKNQPDSALYYYNKSLELAKKLKLNDLVLKNKIQSSVILLHQKRYSELSDLYHKIIPQLEKNNDVEGLIETYTYMSLNFRDMFEKKKSLLYAEKAINLAPQIQDKKLKAFVLGALGGGVIGYFESFGKAEPLIRESIELGKSLNDKVFIRNSYKRMAILHYNNDNIKRAAEIIDSLLPGSGDPDLYKIKGSILYEKNQLKDAERYLNEAYKMYEKDGALIQQKMVIQHLIDTKLAGIGDETFTDYFYLLDSINMVINDKENKAQFIDMETRYRTAEKEAEIKEKELELAESKNLILLISGVAILLIATGAFSFWFVGNRQKQKELIRSKQIFELQNNLNRKELESLNNQLNPHEVKNLITSIAPDIITKAPEAYKKMIKLFNVTRASLSNQLTEPLQSQINQAEDFLQLQQSISPNVWSYEIQNDCEDCNMEIPRLLLKNMVENAVKHGMKTLKNDGEILVSIYKDHQNLYIQIKDNGIGEQEGQKLESTGIGFSTYHKLFKMANKFNERKASLELSRIDSWTQTQIRIPLKYKFHNQLISE